MGKEQLGFDFGNKGSLPPDHFSHKKRYTGVQKKSNLEVVDNKDPKKLATKPIEDEIK